MQTPYKNLPMSPRYQELLEIMRQRVLIIDGAMGTMIHRKDPTIEDWGGDKLMNCTENILVTHPEWVDEIHRDYLRAGVDIIETNTFGGTPLVLAEFDLQDKFETINKVGTELAVKAAKDFSTLEKPRFVAASIGPTTRSLVLMGGISFHELKSNYAQQARVLLEAGTDIFLVETCMDTLNAKAAVLGIEEVLREVGMRYPIMLSGTVERVGGAMLAGQTAEAFTASMSHLDLLSIGLNCATGPDLMTDHIRSITEISPVAVSCYPNAGIPDDFGKFPETPDSLAKALERFLDNRWLNIVGGCCGTTDTHLKAIADMAADKKPRPLPTEPLHRTFYAGGDLLEATDDNRPLLVGERTNVIGSRKFKELIAAENWEEATEIAKRQQRNGAQIIDVCLQSTDRDEMEDIDPFYKLLIAKVPKLPVMIDTTDPKAIEKALTWLQGKSIVNSINLEDGEEKFEIMCPILLKYGAAVVVGSIDEDKQQAQAFTRERKLAIAQRSHELLTKKYGMAEEDLVFDPLVFPCASGDENYIGGAVETIEGIRLIKQHFPYCKTTLGISNVSFGLPSSAREVVNAIFLYECTRAGLDLAIVNAEKLERFAQIPEEEKALTYGLLFNSPPIGVSDDHPLKKEMESAPEDWREQNPEVRAAINQWHIAKVAAHFRGVKKVREKAADLPLDERLARYILEGSKDGLVADLELKRAEGLAPLDIINGPLMTGMTEVGRLFNNNELIVAEVLQSAEAMKTAVAHLEQFMEKEDTKAKGKFLLATVKGDVHDIGKNLVEIILKNNGFDVINLGIKVPPEDLIQAYKEHQPDAIGLSGLLVKSAQQMVITVEDFKAAGVDVPVLVGGAALSLNFTRRKIIPAYDGSVLYCQDAMRGLDTMNRLMDGTTRANMLEEGRMADLDGGNEVKESLPMSTIRSTKVALDAARVPLPYPERKIQLSIPQLGEIFSYINPQMLYVRHLGLKGSFDKKVQDRDPKALELKGVVEELMEEVKPWMTVNAVWRFFEAESEGNTIHLFEPGQNNPVHSFTFPRQREENGLCLADYVLPPLNGRRDNFGMFVVGAGAGVRERSEVLKEKGEYLRSHALQALAIETAEGAAEWLHRIMRDHWGFPDPSETTMRDRFRAKYRGKRYSFGYPACPDMADQEGIWKLLNPGDIGVDLTEGHMMDPEASVSSLVFHHEDCTYFAV